MRNPRLSDIGGATLSGLCLIHCIVLPILSGVLPLAGALAGDRRIHWIIVVLAVPAAIYAFGSRLRDLRNGVRLVALAVLGVALLIGGLFAPEPAEHALTIAGGVALAIAHIANFITMRRQLPRSS